jgi:phosphate transport system protein
MTRALLDKALQELDTQMRRLGSLIEHALAQALEALEMGDQDKAGTVIVSDTEIDDLYLVIEEQTFRTLTLQQPLGGRDLRYLTSLVPMTIDLERIGDEAVAIAQNVLRMMPFRSGGIYQAQTRTQQVQGENSLSTSGGEGDQFSEASIMQGILDLGQMVRSLVQKTMQAFANRDAEAARRLWEEDKVVDRGASRIRRDVMAMLEAAHAMPALQHDPYILQHVTGLLWIAYELERVADHCTNICERIVFIVQGETDIHPSLEQ